MTRVKIFKHISLKALSKTAVDDILIFIVLFFLFCSEKIKLGISSELSARQMICKNCQALFFAKK